MAHFVDAAAHARAVIASLSPEPQGPPSAAELRARALRYRQLSESLITPEIIEVVQACARELEAQASSMESTETSCSL